MEIELRKSLTAIVEDIIARREASFKRPLDPDTMIFCRDCMVEALHNNDAFVHWYGRAKDAEKRVAELIAGTAESRLLAELADARAVIARQREQVAQIARAANLLPPAQPTAKPAKPPSM